MTQTAPEIPTKKSYRLERTAGSGSAFFDRLDEDQRVAVLNSQGRSLIIAGPGSGKTYAITYKVALLIRSGVLPSEILLVTFTRRAAREMIQRAQTLAHQELDGMLSGTFHHVSNVLLRRYGAHVGLQTNFSILDREDSASLVKIARREYLTRNFSKKNQPKIPAPKALVDLFSYMSNVLVSLREALVELHPAFLPQLEHVETIYSDYIQRKQKLNALDYDDLQTYALRLMEENPVLATKISDQFKWVLVDEFQDTSLVQAHLAERWARVHGNLFVVGDDAQSIYSFRGARYENILEFAQHPKCHLFKIENNYRSTRQIVDFINFKIPNNVFQKKLRAVKGDGPKPVIATTLDREDQAQFVAQRIQELMTAGTPASEIGVLYRSHSHSLELQLELTRRGIPFQIYSGVKFTEAAHVKDVLAFLRLLANPRDQIAWDRALMLFEGIGRVTAEKISSRMLQALEQDKDPFLTLRNLVARRQAEGLEKFKELLNKMQDQKAPSKIIRLVLKEFYEDFLETHFANYRERKRDLERLSEIAERYKTVNQFLADILLAEEVEIQSQMTREESVVLTSIHQAKGLEWDVVFVLCVNPGEFPSYWAVVNGELDEEARVFYVAITRPRRELTICRQVFTTGNFADNAQNLEKADLLADVPEELAEFWNVE